MQKSNDETGTDVDVQKPSSFGGYVQDLSDKIMISLKGTAPAACVLYIILISRFVRIWMWVIENNLALVRFLSATFKYM